MVRSPPQGVNLEAVRVGVVGYCPPTRFDEDEAMRLIAQAFDRVELFYPGMSITIVSGLADLGIPGLAYAEATRRGWRTAGVVCRRRAEKYPLFAVDESQIVDEEQESAIFVDSIVLLLRFGGGAQSRDEAAMAKAQGKLVWEYEITAL